MGPVGTNRRRHGGGMCGRAPTPAFRSACSRPFTGLAAFSGWKRDPDTLSRRGRSIAIGGMPGGRTSHVHARPPACGAGRTCVRAMPSNQLVSGGRHPPNGAAIAGHPVRRPAPAPPFSMTSAPTSSAGAGGSPGDPARSAPIPPPSVGATEVPAAPGTACPGWRPRAETGRGRPARLIPAVRNRDARSGRPACGRAAVLRGTPYSGASRPR